MFVSCLVLRGQGGDAVGLGQCALLFSYPSHFFLSSWSWISSSCWWCHTSSRSRGKNWQLCPNWIPQGSAARAGRVHNSLEYCWWWKVCLSWVLMRGCSEVNEPSTLTLSFAGSSDRRVLPSKCWGSELKCCWTLVAFLGSAWDCAAGRKTGFLHRERARQRCL